ncbi:glycosyltransferase family 1 protein [Mycobacterium paraterrae]|uniref:Glycosyltransferase family 1 protein n=1 Tax=Mycobacterium paraterrae TaxID=577492 RepID=A0ABY3VXD1_9MYCO|nr:glycosyltransferase family 1 protein [Mycobacterium paraterrae]UMB72147.1 glycosyltransferase family 1 protein [Mycobacterium paraterrae]
MPASHVYVRHLSPPGMPDDVVRLDDPEPADGRKVPGGWWPPLMLEPGWVTSNHRLFDVFHVHFGFDAVGPDELFDVTRELHRFGKPLVYTVHDLRNPHHPDPRAHTDQQQVLVDAAAELVTLTNAAAEAIRRQWGRNARVLPHPHVLEQARIERQRPHGERFTVGVHAKSLRANMDPLPVLDALVKIVAALPCGELRINVHDEIFDRDNHWFAPDAGAALLEYDRHDHVRVRVHRYFSDDELWDYLSSLTVSVLPYRFGSHSGWLEACFDLGTAAVVPSCGFYHQQHHCGVFEFDEHRFDEESLRRAIDDLYREWAMGRSVPRATWAARRAERDRLAVAHRRLYQSVLS